MIGKVQHGLESCSQMGSKLFWDIKKYFTIPSRKEMEHLWLKCLKLGGSSDLVIGLLPSINGLSKELFPI